jgi:osmotically-inducible protein OsmY
VQHKSDRQIQQEVTAELGWDPRVDQTDVGVSVHDGVVALTGSVPSYDARMAAREAAHRVIGVLDVADDLQVKIPGGFRRDDTDLAQAVRHALEWDVHVPHERIETTVAQGYVTLAGTVDAHHEKEAAERAVRRLLPVRGVINSIDVRAASVSSAAVRAAIEEALDRRAERTAERIRVEVADGTVSLTGPVHSWAEREAVLGAARYTRGVRELQDHLLVAPN